MTRLAVAATVGIALALAVVSFAAAQGGPDVQISQPDFDCVGQNGGPEVVVIKNNGDAAQDLTGWELRSDPEATTEPFDLSALGSLLPGGSVSIQSGPSSSGVFSWGTDEIFRDNDPTDYVKLVDKSGDVAVTVDQVNCAGAAAEPTPTAAPEPSPAAGVPNGGGPPAPSADVLSPGMMALIGGSLAAAGLGAIALPRLRLGASAVAASPSSRGRPAAGRGREDRGDKRGYSTVSLLALTLTAVMLFRFLRRRPD